MALFLYNTLAGKKERFEPADPERVTVYVCGPTVYNMAHLGHARAYVAFDILLRWLRKHYANVLYVRNFTDIDDKIIARAQELGTDSGALSERYIAEFAADMVTLGVTTADVEPRVTDHVDEIIEMIAQLIERGVAYAEQGDVYFAVEKFAGYGKLSGRRLEHMEAGARVAVTAKKRHAMDFVLWKAAKPGEPAWPSPWGEGRPGWHIECSAMAKRYLGETFDIHGGGKDLIFPHHENEIAQSEACTGHPLARYWVHNGFVTVDDEKMSKSLGNFCTVRDLCEHYDGLAVRYYLMTTQYRSPINFTESGVRDAEQRLVYLYDTLVKVRARLTQQPQVAVGEGPWCDPLLGTLRERFEAAMHDDLNTAKALGELSDAFRLANTLLLKPELSDVEWRSLALFDEVLCYAGTALGLFEGDIAAVLQRIEARRRASQAVDSARVEALVQERLEARKQRDFQRADAIRDELQAMGIALKDSAAGTQWEVAR